MSGAGRGNEDGEPGAGLSVGLFIDWRWLSASQTGKAGAGPEPRSVLDAARRYGPIAVARAYGDWARPEHASAARPLYDAGVEPAYVPLDSETDALLSLALDALDLCRARSHIGTYVLLAGDASTGPLVRRLARYGKQVVILTIDEVTGTVQAAPAAARKPPATTTVADDRAAGSLSPLPSRAGQRPPAAQAGSAIRAAVERREIATAPVVARDSLPDQAIPARRLPAPRERRLPAKPVHLRTEPRPPAPVSRVWSFDGSGTTGDPFGLMTLQEIVSEARLPPDGPLSDEQCTAELDALVHAVDDAERRWSGLTSETQQMLIALYAARARALQEQAGVMGDFVLQERLDRVFRALSSFSGQHRPGFVNGLSREHRPDGRSWMDDARAWYGSLEAEAGLAEETAAPQDALLQQLRTAVTHWEKARDPLNSRSRRAVEGLLRSCFREGMSGVDPRLSQIVSPVADRLRSTEFKTLRNAVKRARSGQRRSRSEPATEGGSQSPDGRQPVCGSKECREIAGALGLDISDSSAASPDGCAICGGSRDRRAIMALVRELKVRQIDRLLIVGGTPKKWTILGQSLAQHGIEMRYVNGIEGTVSKADATEDMRWAQVVLIWARTPLAHKVSNLYRPGSAGPQIVTVRKTGIEALCRELVLTLGSRRDGSPGR